MYVYYNPNPHNAKVGDCAIRAISKALNCSWKKAYAMIAVEGFMMCDMPSSDIVWGSLLRSRGFIRDVIPNSCPMCYTVSNFCEDHPKGTFVLALGGHVVTVVDGNLYDSWDSSAEIPLYYYHQKEV